MQKDMQERLQELEDIRQKARQGGGQKRIDRQHAKGKFTARERLDRLVDPGTFSEVGMLIGYQKNLPGEGIVTGHGSIDGREVSIFASDATVSGGSTGMDHGFKMYKAVERALDNKVPLISLYESPGARAYRLDQPDEVYYERSVDSVFFPHVQASGLVPQIAAMLGPNAGASVYWAALQDFIIMVEGTSQMFITGPRVTKSVIWEDVTMEELGGARLHTCTSGVADWRVPNEDECFKLIKRLLSFIPQNSDEKPPRVNTGDDPNRLCTRIEEIVPLAMSKPYDMRAVMKDIVDNGDLLEVKPEYAQEVIVAFGRLGGQTVGMVGNQPRVLAGGMTVKSSAKQARFMRFCDCFNIPIILLADTPGYIPGTASEKAGIIRSGAKVLYAQCEATVPKIAIICRKAYGGGQNGMGVAPGMGTDFVFCWPTADVGVMGDKQTVELLYSDEINKSANPDKTRQDLIETYRKRYGNPFEAASLGRLGIEDVFAPRETRRRLIQSLRLLQNKRQARYTKRHGNIPL